MERTANEIQKERRKEIEDKADELIKKRDVATLTSINEKDTRVFVYCLLQRQKNFQMFTL